MRPGVPGLRPFWNGRASFFIYAPAFDFPEVQGAASYRFAVTSGTNPGFTFEADKPRAALTPVWKDLPFGPLGHQAGGRLEKGRFSLLHDFVNLIAKDILNVIFRI